MTNVESDRVLSSLQMGSPDTEEKQDKVDPDVVSVEQENQNGCVKVGSVTAFPTEQQGDLLCDTTAVQSTYIPSDIGIIPVSPSDVPSDDISVLSPDLLSGDLSDESVAEGAKGVVQNFQCSAKQPGLNDSSTLSTVFESGREEDMCLQKAAAEKSMLAQISELQGKVTSYKQKFESALSQAELLCAMKPEISAMVDHIASLEGLIEGLQAQLGEAKKKNQENLVAELEVKLSKDAEKINTLEDKVRALEEEISSLRNDSQVSLQENQVLTDKLTKFVWDESTLRNDDARVKFYTGLPSYTLLMHVFHLVSENITLSPKCALSKFQEFLIVLMRLRLGLLGQDLAYRFGVHPSTISRIIERWLVPMSHALEGLLAWPDRETLQKTMPLQFQRNFGKSVAVIVDCFEVFIDRPSSLVTRAATWSQYKHHNTVKFLIGITPQGSVSYISKAWVGRTSDKHLTENCGILDNLLPNDVVMADRGFNIDESVGFVGAKLVLPRFTKGKPQLSYDDVEVTRKIANVRIHVERVIGYVRRKYKILQSTLPVELLVKKGADDLAPIDHIVRIACALTNLCPPIVSME